jgi:hypothetical protein
VICAIFSLFAAGLVICAIFSFFAAGLRGFAVVVVFFFVVSAIELSSFVFAAYIQGIHIRIQETSAFALHQTRFFVPFFETGVDELLISRESGLVGGSQLVRLLCRYIALGIGLAQASRPEPTI